MTVYNAVLRSCAIVFVCGQALVAQDRWLDAYNLDVTTKEKIHRARPSTEIGKKIAIKPVMTRADLAYILLEEMNLN